MADRVVDRLIVAVGFKVDSASASKAVQWGGRIAGAVAAATVALATYTVTSAAALDATVKQGRALALTAEQYTEWLFVAERSGIAANTFGEGMNQLTERLRSAAAGSKEAVAPFDRLGVSVRKADGTLKTAAEILPELADGLNRVDSEGERAQLTIGVLGESGAKLRSLLDLGSDGIARMKAEGRELGAVLSNETGANAEALTDSVTNLSKAFGGIRNRLLTQTMPTLTVLSRRLTAVLTDSDGIVRVGLDRAVDAIGHAFTALEHPAGQAALAIGAVAGIWAGANATMSTPVLGAVSKGIVGLGGAFKALAAGAATLLGLPLGVFAGFVAAAAATVGTLYLVWDEFMVTARGGDSVIRRVADSLGVGKETAEAFAGSLAIASGALALTVSIGSQLVSGIGAIGSAIVSMVNVVRPPLQWLLDGLYFVLGAMPRGIGQILQGVASFAPVTADGEQTTFLGSALQRAGGALVSGGELVQQGPQEMLRATLSGFGQAGQSVGGALSGAAAAEDRKAAGLGPARTLNQDVTINLTSASRPDEIAAAIIREQRRANAALEGR